MVQHTGRLENWGLTDDKKNLFGNIFEDAKERFTDGQYIKTTPQFGNMDLDDLKEGDLVVTKSSVYLLGKKQPDYDARLENWTPLFGGGISGFIYADKKRRFFDNDFVYTSKVVEGELSPYNVVQTRNSTYLLGKPAESK
jgi:hypothetical protein